MNNSHHLQEKANPISGNPPIQTPLGAIDAALEVEYDNSGRVEGAKQIIDGYINDSLDFREKIGERASLGLSYGPAPRNQLDIFWPTERENCPITMFIHGGYWQMLDRTAFSHLASGLNAKGIAVAIPSYTLCPQNTVLGIIDEMRRACVVLWQTFNRNITVFGHSAGGHLAACMVATDWRKLHSQLPADLVLSGLGISGLYDLEPLTHTSVNKALKLISGATQNVSPIGWLVEPDQRFDAWVGGEESNEYHRQSRTLVDRWHMLGCDVNLVIDAGKNHFTIIHALTDRNSDLVKRIHHIATANANLANRLNVENFRDVSPPDPIIDDLNVISGIGKKMAEKLATIGITSIADIALLDESRIAEIDKSLNFKGRITRDGWVEQAKELLEPAVEEPENEEEIEVKSEQTDDIDQDRGSEVDNEVDEIAEPNEDDEETAESIAPASKQNDN